MDGSRLVPQSEISRDKTRSTAGCGKWSGGSVFTVHLSGFYLTPEAEHSSPTFFFTSLIRNKPIKAGLPVSS